jgi:tRNA-dihydrouridine synthase B
LQGGLDWNGPVQGLREMRGRYARYLKGLPDIAGYLQRLVRLADAAAVLGVLAEIEEKYDGYLPRSQPITLENYHTHCTL